MKYLIFFLFLFGCASNEDKAFVEQVSPDLVETFKIENDKFKKFVVEKKEPQEVEIKKKVAEAPPKPKKVEIKKKEIEEKPQPVLKITSKKDIVEVPEPPEQESIPEPSAIPDDYPKELIELDKESAKTWEGFKPVYRIGEEFVMAIDYLGITAGHVRFMTQGGLKIADKDALHFRALFKTAKFYKYIYEADDMVETYVSADRFIPIKYSLVQRESNKDVDDLQLFDHDLKKTYVFYKRLKKKNNQLTKKEMESYITTYFQDFMSTLYFVRGLPLKSGDVYKFPVFTRGKFWRLTIKVTDVNDQVKVMDNWRKAIRLETVALPPKADKKKKESTITFWYSKDPERVFLKLSAELKFGSIEGVLEDHKPGRMP